MKKLFLSILLILSLTKISSAAPVMSRRVDFTTIGTSTLPNTIGTGINAHRMVWNISGTASLCTIRLQYSNDGSTNWSDVPNIAGDCTSSGSVGIISATYNYYRLNLSALTPTSSVTISVYWGGYIDIPSTAFSGTGTVLQAAYFSTTNTISSAPGLDFITGTGQVNSIHGNTYYTIQSGGNTFKAYNTGGYCWSSTSSSEGSADTCMTRGGAGLFWFGDGTTFNNTSQIGDSTHRVGSSYFTALNLGTANSALAGVIRLPNNDNINFRNAANGADLRLIGSDGSNNVLLGDSTSLLTIVPKINSYNALSTAGNGIISILAAPAVSATKTANFTVFTYTKAATASVYEVSGVIVTDSTTNTGTVQLTLDYFDSQGGFHSGDIMPLILANGTIATTGTAASKEFHSVPWIITTRASADNIVLKVVITGTVSYTVTGTVKQLL